MKKAKNEKRKEKREKIYTHRNKNDFVDNARIT
jgi:hypothetical protein